MSQEEAGARYLEIVGPRNDASCQVGKQFEAGLVDIPEANRVAGVAADAARTFGQELVATDWYGVQPVIDDIVESVSGGDRLLPRPAGGPHG